MPIKPNNNTKGVADGTGYKQAEYSRNNNERRGDTGISKTIQADNNERPRVQTVQENDTGEKRTTTSHAAEI